MSIPFTYEQAQEICEDFEDLEGTELVIRMDPPVKCEIERICISPFEQAAKQDFVAAYASVADPISDFKSYEGAECDVLLFARSVKNKEQLIVLTIEEYIATNGVNYNFPG
ncbi:MAG: hypothetical protein K0R82_238 [Flavipsychrobacter sp.]|jgi:hypothetical protein|nr:hypothetical protein [Flavipsychrobacter sp.]